MAFLSGSRMLDCRLLPGLSETLTSLALNEEYEMLVLNGDPLVAYGDILVLYGDSLLSSRTVNIKNDESWLFDMHGTAQI